MVKDDRCAQLKYDKSKPPSMRSPELFNLEFTATVDKRHRVYIPQEIAQIACLRKGEKVTLILRYVHRMVRK